MPPGNLIKPVPWDAAPLGVDCYELQEASPEAIAQARETPGHYTVRVDPQASKRLLHAAGFHYCDTLLEPHCSAGRLVARTLRGAAVTRDTRLVDLLHICHGAFAHDRFHRDFTVDPARADARYDRWLTQLHAEGRVYGLLWGGELAGFAAAIGGHLALHAVAVGYRGRGLAPGLWTCLCEELFASGVREITSSVSAANLAALNLYAALGFRFRRATDIYHRLVE